MRLLRVFWGGPEAPRSLTRAPTSLFFSHVGPGALVTYCLRVSSEIRYVYFIALALLAVAVPASAESGKQPVANSGSIQGSASTEQLILNALDDFNEGARFPLPRLSPGEVERVVQGKVLKLREVGENAEQSQRAVGLLRTRHSREGLWLAARDIHYTAVDELVEVQLTPAGQWPSVWYQYLDLPRPFSDRHWVVDVVDTHQLARTTGGRCWEHAWQLSKEGLPVAEPAIDAGRVPGVDRERAEAAIYTPVNEGAWLVIDLGDGTSLLGYHVTSVIGGAIPDKLVADFTLLTLGKLLRGVVDRVDEVVGHYAADHTPIEGGDGVPLTAHLGRP